MQKITVSLKERSYDIFIGKGHLERLPSLLKEVITYERILVISNDVVGELYGDKVVDVLSDGGFTPELFEIPDGEKYKTLDTLRTIYDFLISNNYPRQSSILALGGGVVGDVAGFAAATFMRGINFVQLPTTLLAMVDASVGGKVAVNHPLGKNMIGAFYQPRLVFIELDFLKTLLEEEFRAGFAEVIKYGVIRDREFFEFLEESIDRIFQQEAEALERVVETSCRIKAEVVEQDERESGLRAILNFGHTIGHAIESLTRYSQYKHGEAVAIGMVAASRIANKMELLDSSDVQRIWQMVKDAGLPFKFPKIDPEDILERMKKDKKVLGDTVRFILPRRIGEVEIRSDVPAHIVEEVLREMRET